MKLPPYKGRILISEPFLSDPNFNRTVVLLTEHSDEGTVGFVLNQTTDVSVNLVVPALENITSVVRQGGPVEMDSFHYIHTYKELPGAVDLGNGVYWSGDFDNVVEGLESGYYKEDQFKFFVGYSGWAADQLHAELHEEAWIVGEIERADIFGRDLDDKALWQNAMRNLGGEFAILANSPINPHLN